MINLNMILLFTKKKSQILKRVIILKVLFLNQTNIAYKLKLKNKNANKINEKFNNITNN